LTTPAIADWARAAVGRRTVQANTSSTLTTSRESGLCVYMAALPAATTGTDAAVVSQRM
jgi:hypothetical protein